MADIKISQGKHRTTIIGLSDKGKLWLEMNTDAIEDDETGEIHLTVNNEYAQDFKDDFKDAGLEWE